MTENGKTFVLCGAHRKLLSRMNAEQKAALLDALFAYNDGEEVTIDDPLADMAFMVMTEAIERMRKFQEQKKKNGQNGGRPKSNRNQDEPSDNQGITKNNQDITKQNQDKPNDNQEKAIYGNGYGYINGDLNTPLSSNEDIPPQGEVASKGKRKETIASVLDEQPQELISALTEFVNHRKSIKKPLTAHALRLNIKDLQRLAPGDIQKQKELIEYAIKKGWQGFYLPNDEKQYTNASHVPRAANFSQQLRLEQDMQAKALLAASQRRNENAQLIGDGRTDNEAELALPPEWRAF